MNYEEKFNLPLEKISDFAKYVADYYFTNKRRKKIKKNINNLVIDHLKFTLDYFNPNDILIYLYLMDKYKVRRTIKNLGYFFDSDIKKIIDSGQAHLDGKNNVIINDKEKQLILQRDERNNVEDNLLYRKYGEITEQYGKLYNWVPLEGKTLWNKEFTELNDQYYEFHAENDKLGLGYTYKNVIPKRKIWDDILNTYFD